jgi:hypothetical protein
MLLVAVFLTIGVVAAIAGCILILKNKNLFFSKSPRSS